MAARARVLFTTLAVALWGLTQPAEAAPPFSGTIFLDPDIITAADPTTFDGLADAGRGRRTMFDRRTNRFESVNAYLFRASYRDLPVVEVQVNPEFGSVDSARAQALKYAEVVGRLPRLCRVDVKALWIQDGLQPFGGGNRSLLIHTQQSALYEADGILEETLVHEASHTSLDARHARAPKWRAAQRADAEFISTYARDNATREDVAESFLPYYALRYRRDRIDTTLATTIQNAIPNRIAYFDGELLVETAPLYPTATVVRTGEAVPGAGTVEGLPVEAAWTSFEVPSINDRGDVAFLGKWKSGRVTGAAICAGSATAPALVVTTGAAAAGVSGAVFGVLQNPLLAGDGALAFTARLANAPGQSAVSPATDEGLWLEVGGSRTLIAREGGDVDGLQGARWKTVTSVALCETALAFTAKISSVPPATDEGLWVRERATGTTRLALQKGTPFLQSTIKGLAAFAPRPGSLGQGRGAVAPAAGVASIAVRITLADGAHVVASVNEKGSVSVVCDGTQPATIFASSGTPPTWQSLGLPSQAGDGRFTFLGTVKPAGGPTLADNAAIFVENGSTTERAVLKGDVATGAAPGRFASFLDPVNATGGAFAFLATLANDRAGGISAANHRGLWSRRAGGALTLIARAGNQAPDAASGVVFKSLSSLCLPEGTRGPLFTGTLANRSATEPSGSARRVGKANQDGLWGVDAAGAARLLARTGQFDETFRQLKAFEVFTAVLGSAGQARGYNAGGKVIYLATHTDRSQSIAIVSAP